MCCFQFIASDIKTHLNHIIYKTKKYLPSLPCWKFVNGPTQFESGRWERTTPTGKELPLTHLLGDGVRLNLSFSPDFFQNWSIVSQELNYEF